MSAGTDSAGSAVGPGPTGPLERIVIVGYGVAGLTAGDALRDAGFDGELVIVGEEPGAPYSRPALSKALLSGTADEPDLSVLDLPAPAHGGTEVLGRCAVGLDPVERTLTLDDGATLAWDGLVIATGARPRRFTDSADEFTVRTLPETLALRQRLAERQRVTVIGGGPLGMEVASGARALGCDVTLVHPGTPMARQVGPYLGALCARAATDHGVHLIDDTATGVRAVAADAGPGTDGGFVIEFGSGDSVTTDVVVTAIGDVPNDAWLADSGLLRDGRLVVDDRGVVAQGAHAQRIVATGDVAWLGPDSSAATAARVPLWMHAIDHAKTAAEALVHGPEATPFAARPYFWTEQFGLHVRMAGPVPAGDPEVVDGDPASGSALLRWDGGDDADGTAVAINYRIPVPRLRRLAAAAPAVA